MKKQRVDWQTIFTLLKILFGVVFLVNLVVAMFGNNWETAIVWMTVSGFLFAVVSAVASSMKKRANTIQTERKE